MDYSSTLLIVPTCHHRFDNNRRCRAATRHNRLYCDAHLQLRVRRIKMAKARRRVRMSFRMPPLIDVQAVELTKARVRVAQAGGYMDNRTASLMLYGLRIMASNIRFCDQLQNTADRLRRPAPRPEIVTAKPNDSYYLPVALAKSSFYIQNTSQVIENTDGRGGVHQVSPSRKAKQKGAKLWVVEHHASTRQRAN